MNRSGFFLGFDLTPRWRASQPTYERYRQRSPVHTPGLVLSADQVESISLRTFQSVGSFFFSSLHRLLTVEIQPSSTLRDFLHTPTFFLTLDDKGTFRLLYCLKS